ncbi:uncharacterized protein BJX67DRAFT_330051 [Aspergillus lucknowensis]|uniref:DUF7702 domain-containing protein n=1 Tax=Aspergillus lucknowensis TaxID=176173 RepID=A0ABR4L832_9EURO
MTTNGHEILACLELVLYGTLIVPATLCTFHYLFKKQTAWLYLHAFIIAKIAGPAIYLSISKKSNPSTGLQMASQILYSIALGPLLSATLSFVNTSPSTSSHSGPKDQEHNPNPASTSQATYAPLPLSLAQTTKGAPLNGLLRLVHPIIIVGLVLGIIGGIDRSPNSSTGLIDADKFDRGATFQKVSSALFLVALVGIAVGVASLWKGGRRATLATVSHCIISAMPLILPLLFLRVLYSILAAANLDTTRHMGHTTRFNILNGSWVVYLFLGFIPQGAVMVAYTGCGVVAWLQGRREGRY